MSLGLVVLTLGTGCASDDPDVERRGGDLPDPPTGGTSNGSAGGDGAGGDAPIKFCDALVVAQNKCQRCHGTPLKNGAPVPFETYDDFQAPYGTSGVTYGEVAIRLVEDNIMPYVSLNDSATPPDPPVEPLTADEKATLLGWLKQGAKPEGGTSCP
jgi:hypothetical protein